MAAVTEQQSWQEHDTLPHAPTAFTRVLERSITMSPARTCPKNRIRANIGTGNLQSASTKKTHNVGIRSISSPPRSPASQFGPTTPTTPRGGAMQVSMGAFRGIGRQLRPKSAPTNMRSTNGARYVNAYSRDTLKHMSDDEEQHFSEAVPSQSDASATTQKPGVLDIFDISYLSEFERSGMQLGISAGPSVSHAEMEVILSQLQSATPETQMQGIQRMQAFEYSPDLVELLIQLGHLDALCALTAAFLRQRQQASTKTIGETLETHPGFCAMHIMFRIGAVTKGFRSVGVAIVALALAMPTPRDTCVPDADGASGVQVPVEDGFGGFPPLSHVVANKSDPLKLGVIDDQQHFTWNPHSLTLQGLPHGNRKAVEAVAVGSHLWVYTLAKGRSQKKAFQTFVQLLPAGGLFIGGKEQQVSAVSVVQGSTPDLDAAFNLSIAQAECVFRVQAMPQDCALAATEPISLAFGARSIQERDSWIHGVSVIILRNSAASKSCAVGAKLSSTSTPVGERSKSSFQGACDEDGIPCGHGIALSLDGSKHMGNWVQGMLSGQGALLLPSGNKYMGEWREGLAHGYGVHFSLKGARYEGEWLNDAQHGYGVEYDTTERPCTHDQGVLKPEADLQYEDSKNREREAQEARLIAIEAAGRAKKVAIETSRLVMDIESSHTQASKLSAPSSSKPLPAAR